MLKERTYHRKIQIVSGYNSRHSNPESVAKDLQRNVIDVRSVTWQKDNRVLFLRSLFSNRA